MQLPLNNRTAMSENAIELSNPSLRDREAQMIVGGFSFPGNTDKKFVQEVLRDVLATVDPGEASEAVLTGCTPYDAPGDVAILVLSLLAGGRTTASLGVTFGERASDGAIVRRGFDRDNWTSNPTSHLAAGISAATFDEAWLLLCGLGEAMKVPLALVRYGA